MRLLIVQARGRAGLRVGPLRSCSSSLRRNNSTRNQIRADAPPLDLPALDRKWRLEWLETGKEMRRTGSWTDPGTQHRRNMYILPMFPYPSGKLHLGHLRVYTIADVMARYHRLQGKRVLLPMGWDAFGLPAENAAIERGVHPAEWTVDNIERMKNQLNRMNGVFTWSKELSTCDSTFYGHTQRVFLYLMKMGLVERRLAEVNWDPVDKTVLANEQVDAAGRSWRSGAVVEKRQLKQWFFRITKYQDVLLEDLEKLGADDAWPEQVLTQQKNWLGRSDNAYYQFTLERQTAGDQTDKTSSPSTLTVYTTRPETIFGVQYIAFSPQSPFVQALAKNDPDLQTFLNHSKDLPYTSTEGYKIPYLTAISPLENMYDMKGHSSNHSIPVYVASYVRGDYETGAVMGVPAHDLRDFAFWKRHQPEVPVKYAVSPANDGSAEGLIEPFLGSGFMTSLAGSHKLTSSEQAARDVPAEIQRTIARAEPAVKWKLRDWLISRQRYWGTPIPIIHCKTCGPQPVPEHHLPVRLPTNFDYEDVRAKAGNPLDVLEDWVNTKCPKCHQPAKRETDTMDTFVDSSWYYMRFPDVLSENELITRHAIERFLPVDLYIGGVEHAILHLLYARFIYKVLMDRLYPSWAEKQSLLEPFKRLITQGMVHGKTYSDPETGRFLKPNEVDLSDPMVPKLVSTGAKAHVTFEKMSKSKYNGVDPTTFIAQYGADATRAHMLFQAPVNDVINWDENKITGITRWLKRLHRYIAASSPVKRKSGFKFNGKRYFRRLLQEHDEASAAQREADINVWRATQRGITTVTQAYDKVYALNTAVSHLMEWTNALLENQASDDVKLHSLKMLLRMMAPITPAFAEECWSLLFPEHEGIFRPTYKSWPEPDGTLELLGQTDFKCAVQVNGKLRCVVQMTHAPDHLKPGSPEFQDWFVKQIMKNEEVQQKLMRPDCDIRSAKKAIVVKGGQTANFVV